jgi:hypothetical protein
MHDDAKAKFSDQFNQRSAPLWRWVAAGLAGLNILLFVLSVFSLLRPDLWKSADPFPNFTFLTAAIIFLQLTPFARSLWLGEKAAHNGEIDEYERIEGQRVLTNAYRATGGFMLGILILLMLASQFSEIRLTTVSAGYFLMWFAFIFFSFPAIFAGFTLAGPPKAEMEDDA